MTKRIEIQVHEQTARFKFGTLHVREEVAVAVIMVRRDDGTVELPCAGYGDTDTEAVHDLIEKFRAAMTADRRERRGRKANPATWKPYEQSFKYVPRKDN